MRYKIRVAVPDDENKIRDLFLEMLRTIHHTNNVDGYEDGYLDRFWAENEDLIYVAENSEVVAFLSIEVHHEQEAYAYFDDFSVTATYRGKGIGSELIKAAEAYAKKLNISSVFLHVEKTNQSAMRLYWRLGYLVYSDDGHRYLMKKNM